MNQEPPPWVTNVSYFIAAAIFIPLGIWLKGQDTNWMNDYIEWPFRVVLSWFGIN